MNETPSRYLQVGQEVIFIGQDEKPHRGKITELFPGCNGARIESLDGTATAVADYSETGEVNTFSFPSASAETETT